MRSHPARPSRQRRRLPLLAPLALLLALAPEARAQTPVETGSGVVQGLPVGARNGVATLATADGTVYAGPRLVAIGPDGVPRYVGDNAAFLPPVAEDPRAFSIAARGDRVVVGLGFTDETDPDDPLPAAAGFAFSSDGGQTWAARPAALDAATATTVQYGASTLPAAPIFTPLNAAPYDVALDPASGAVYSANADAGLRVSTDNGQTWRRVVLPPDTLRVIAPGGSYSFPYAPAGVQLPGATDPRDVSLFGFNFVAYSVLVDEEGTVWAGTLAGLNRGDAETVDPASGDRAWIRYESDAARPGPVGNFIVSLEAREIEDARDEIWMAAWPSGRPVDLAPRAEDERFGVTVWRGDMSTGEPVFETVLLGERIYDLAFSGETVYAAGQNGLFISEDGGTAWRAVRVFREASGAVLPVRPEAGVFAVTVAEDGTLWAGTGDGLLRSDDGGATWTLFRASVPTDPDVPTDETPEVEVYAYPNPFSPRTDRVARIRFDLDAAADVRVRVFDFAMRLVADLDAGARPAGANEVLWTGTADGARVANGAYVYVVDAGDNQLSGKILVLD